MATGSDDEIEEERRLFYVACTRAKQALYVAYPLRYYAQPFGKGDRYGYAQRSRFLTDRVLPHFVDVPAAQGVDAVETPASDAAAVTNTAAIRSAARDLWAS